jgi:Acetyltransferase (GNAT) domain
LHGSLRLPDASTSSRSAWWRSLCVLFAVELISYTDITVIGFVLGASSVALYYALYEMNTERWGTAEKTRHHKDSFERLAACPLTRRLIAYKDGEAAAGFISLEVGGYILYYLGASNRSFTQCRPTSFGLSELIRRTIDRGVTTLNFGSSLGIDSLERFKENFGATPARYCTHFVQDSWTWLSRAIRYYRTGIDAVLNSRPPAS